MQKEQISQTYDTQEDLYFNVVADLTLLPPGDSAEEEHYRFVYYGQKVASEVFRQNQLESMQIGLLIVLALVTVVGVILVAFVFIRWVVPAIGLLRNRMLVEERDDPKDDSIPVPPSSDRNQIGTNNLDPDVEAPPATEDQMK